MKKNESEADQTDEAKKVDREHSPTAFDLRDFADNFLFLVNDKVEDVDDHCVRVARQVAKLLEHVDPGSIASFDDVCKHVLQDIRSIFISPISLAGVSSVILRSLRSMNITLTEEEVAIEQISSTKLA